MTRRIERAKALLRRGDLSVTDVCLAVGCTSLGSFSSRFTELVGESPSSPRRQHPHSVAGMELKLSHCFITVHDQDIALAFYRDVLGLEVRNDVSFDDFRWPSVFPPSQPEVEITLQTPGMGGADCDATFETLRATGAEVMQEPIDQPYGVRDCALRDPSGNQLRFSQVKS